MRLYLDWNATTPPLPEVIDAMTETARASWGNPASVHGRGRAARDVVESARERLAELLEQHPRDVIFTSGGTEANNLALRGAAALVTSRLEHPSVTRVAEALEAEGKPVVWLPVPPEGTLRPEDVAAALARLGEIRAVVAITAVNHETGVVQPVAAIAERTREAGASLHVDAVQALGKLEPARYRGADTVAVAAHKIRGPKGIGALVHRPDRPPRPILLGGSQERGRRPGTVDPVAAAGFAAALAWAKRAPSHYLALASLRDGLERALGRDVAVNGAGAERAPHVSNLSFMSVAGDEAVAALDLDGVEVSSGSACSAGTTEPSPVITAIAGVERARRAVRISFGEVLSRSERQHLFAAFGRLVGRQLQEVDEPRPL